MDHNEAYVAQLWNFETRWMILALSSYVEVIQNQTTYEDLNLETHVYEDFFPSFAKLTVYNLV